MSATSFLFVILLVGAAFNAHGVTDESAEFTVWAVGLAAVFADIIPFLFRLTADESQEAIIDAYRQDVLCAWKAEDYGKADEKLIAMKLFKTRGAV